MAERIDDFQSNLQNPEQVSNESIIKEIDADNEKEYLKEIKKKNKGFLIDGLTVLEKERLGRFIIERFNEVKTKHNTFSDKIDDWDSVYRMERKELPGSDGETPNYRTPLTTVALEVIHANMINVFFTPKDWVRALPTEEGDMPKVKKLDVFANWSAKNELKLFEQVDRLFHNSSKVGEAPYLVHWVKEYGTEIVRDIVRNPANPTEPLYDPDTKEPIFQEREEPKLLYNGPKLEIFSRKDYYQPENAIMDKTPEWEMRKIRLSYDEYLKEQLQGKMYADSIREIMDWGGSGDDSNKEDYEGEQIPVGKWNKEFLEFYGRLRVNVIKSDGDDEEMQELEEEFIAVVNIESETLCQLRKNKFPLKMRPMGMDYFIPDDEGRRAGIGVPEFLDGMQKGYDALFNQFVLGTMGSNNPIIFYEPMGNTRNEPKKLKLGYMYPTHNSASIKIFQLPPPNQSIQNMLELFQSWSQLLFGISDYSAGVESKIDPTAPAKKAEIVVQQGNVRLNAIIKRKNKTLNDIFKRWFLLYKENMPPNKYMRIVGESEDNPFKFEAVTLSDFSLKSLPDFEMKGNVLNVNKALEANKAIAIYGLLTQNPFFNPQSPQGLQSLHALTKWLIDKFDETGLSRFLPSVPGEQVQTPEEENARFMQGDSGEPTQEEDHANHIRIHHTFIANPNIPQPIKENVMAHIQAHIQMLQQKIQQQQMMQQAGIDPSQFAQPQQGGGNGQQGGQAQGTSRPAQGMVPQQPAGMGGLGGGV